MLLAAIKQTDIAALKAIKSPTVNVKLALAAMCVTLGIPQEKMTDAAAKKLVTKN